MKDLQQELIERLRAELPNIDGIDIIIDECSAFSVDHVDVEEGWKFYHVHRQFSTMQFDGLVAHFLNEVKTDVEVLRNIDTSINKFALLFRETPSYKDKKVIRYVKIASKQERNK